ncbi:MAG: LpxL/LpxP family Kdo(2)-lipid IV(A) lauroyl/palmitoleoyl acyltransferase [Francisellaceae bacterium]
MRKEFLKPQYWGIWLGVFAMRLFVLLPYKFQMHCGIKLARICYPFLKRRKHIAITNLKIAFPEKSPAEIEQLCKKCFDSIGASAMETIIAWFMSERRFQEIKFQWHGRNHFEQAHNDKESGTLMLGFHFTCMEVIGRYIGMNYKPFNLVYQKHKNPLFEKVMTDSRSKNVSRCLQRKNVISIVKALKNKETVWYAPDQDFGRERSIFVPFFGKDCATLVATSWLADKTGARVIPCFYTRKADLSGYDIHILPALNNFPSGDDYADALRCNNVLEMMIRQYPDQYLWQHRRFKTRPKDEDPLY